MTTDTKTYLFTCATGSGGNVGGNTLRSFHARATKAGLNFKIRIGARSASKAQKQYSDLGDAIEVVEMDLGDGETYSKALDGVCAVFLGAPDFGGMESEELLKRFVEVVEKLKERLYVIRFVGAALDDKTIELAKSCDSGLFDGHVMAVKVFGEARKKGKVDVSIVDAQSWFFQNYTTRYLGLVKKGNIAIPNGGALLPYIDTRDIGDVVAVMMVDMGTYRNKDVALTGNAEYTTKDWADMISKVTGKKIEAGDGEELYKELLAEGGMSESWDEMKRFHEFERECGKMKTELHPEVYERIVGKKHRSAKDFCKEMAPIWKAE